MPFIQVGDDGFSYGTVMGRVFTLSSGCLFFVFSLLRKLLTILPNGYEPETFLMSLKRFDLELCQRWSWWIYNRWTCKIKWRLCHIRIIYRLFPIFLHSLFSTEYARSRASDSPPWQSPIIEWREPLWMAETRQRWYGLFRKARERLLIAWYEMTTGRKWCSVYEE